MVTVVLCCVAGSESSGGGVQYRTPPPGSSRQQVSCWWGSIVEPAQCAQRAPAAARYISAIFQYILGVYIMHVRYNFPSVGRVIN